MAARIVDMIVWWVAGDCQRRHCVPAKLDPAQACYLEPERRSCRSTAPCMVKSSILHRTLLKASEDVLRAAAVMVLEFARRSSHP
jgi:hypothetical protein